MSSSDSYLSNDPYQRFIEQEKYQQNLIQVDKSSKFFKKVNKLKVAMSNAKVNMLNGAMMGFMVGGLFGLVVGTWSAIQTRRLIMIPMSVIISGGSFGFILGCGSVMRSDTLLPPSQKANN
jgi:tetrahydromethanopterin S-methyltransferase subunit G